MISKLVKISTEHNTCEDSAYYIETDMLIYGGVFDGCSKGINSAFASQFLAYAFEKRNHFLLKDTSNFIVKLRLEQACTALGLSFMHLLSTCVLFLYDKEKRTLSVRVFGDGVYYVNGEKFTIDQSNQPDYIAYNIGASTKDFIQYLKKYPIITYKDVESFVICSDGITSFRRSSFAPKAPLHEDPVSFLLLTPVAQNILERRYNILKKDGYYIIDDLSVISYVQDLRTTD